MVKAFSRAYETLGVPNGLPADREPAFAAWHELLVRWNKKINLTRLVSPEDAVVRHLLDSLPLAQMAAAGSHLLDIGSGAGAPGLIVAALRADVRVTCTESAAKKAAFLVQAASAMKLTNVRVEAIRAEKLAERFDLITARAVAKPDDLIHRFGHLLRPGGGFAFFLAAGDEGCDLRLCRTRREIEYSLPGNAGDRKLVLAQIIQSAAR